MLKFTENDIKFIKEHFDNPDEIFAMEELNDVLDTLFDWIEEHGYEPPRYYDYNDIGRAAQTVYDTVLINNVPNPDDYLTPIDEAPKGVRRLTDEESEKWMNEPNCTWLV